MVCKMVATISTGLLADSQKIFAVGVRATTCRTALQIITAQDKEDITVKITAYFLSIKI
jgi:hypothetical protein